MKWWDGTWNPIGGCFTASPGCRNCYAQKLAATQQTAHQIPLYRRTTDWVNEKPVFNGHLTELPREHPSWTWPLRWRGAKQPLLGTGMPSLIFVGDMTDLFYEKRRTAIIDRVVERVVISDHIGQLLTKRADVMNRYFAAAERTRRPKTLKQWRRQLWLGFSAERQKEFDDRWAHMRELAARGWTVFCSIGPMLAPVQLPPDFLTLGSRAWVICSGEQGTDARHMDPDWARAVRDQCAEAGVPFFLLQMTGKKPIPRDLLVRQFPGCDEARAYVAA